MIQQLSITDLVAGVIGVLKRNTAYEVFDHYPKDQALPFINVEMIGIEPVPSKTMWKDKIQIYIHGWADGRDSSQPIFDMADAIREAMTVAVPLPSGYDLLMQKPEGLQRILPQADGSNHLIIGYSITVTYGFKMKI